MNSTRHPGRRRPAPLRSTATALGAVGLLTLALTACQGEGGSAAAPAPSSSATAQPGVGAGTDAAATPAGRATPGTGGATASTTAGPAASTPAVSVAPSTASPADTAPDCDHRMPISPDEIAVLRYTPEGGSLSLIFRHGNWDCPAPDSDGPPFVTVGKETYLPLDQAAYVTATDPIVASTENQQIGVQEFLDWLEAHPNSGLVFTYHVGADGAIDRLEQIFTP
ncbi:hypothetical protein AB0L04_12645 [Streptomyces glaucescens]|uniref:hypothetical protein n=1 Tax=Streptomyces glaucescens TaxID=1907 RepID=UPI00344CB94F